MTRYKPAGFADYLAFSTLEAAITAAKANMSQNSEVVVYAITPAATITSSTATVYDITITKEPTNV